MAYTPGIFTNWPWQPLGSFKYMVLAPWVVHSIHSYIVKEDDEKDLGYLLLFPLTIFRIVHNQIWISLSRYRNAKGNNRIVDKGIEYEQVDREGNWHDQIIHNGLIFYLSIRLVPGASGLPMWRTDGAILVALLHIGPVEFLYYWFHRALHHHFLYTRYHSHHHSSIVTEPITSVIHPFAEHVAYSLLFAIPLVSMALTGMASIGVFFAYVTYIDFMNNLGHCNFEFVPKTVFSIFPFLKYLMYTPSYHSLHHTKFRTNYTLFMPLYDYIYSTVDESTDEVYESSLQRPEEIPDAVHLTHLTGPQSIYHLPVGIATFASRPQAPVWYLSWLLWPVTVWSMMLSWIYNHAFVVERNIFKKTILQIWAIPKYSIQYYMAWQKQAINSAIEEAILKADEKGIKVLSLGLLNQGEELNRYGEMYIQKQPQLKIKVIDGSSLVVGVVLNSIPKGTSQVLIRGNLNKVAYAVASALCQKGVQVATLHEDEYKKLKFYTKSETNLLVATSHHQKIWLLGDGFNEKEQLKASRGTLFIPFSQLPPNKLREDCVYYHTPALMAPPSVENMHSCENWLPRRAMSAWRVAGIVHALEGWNSHECGNTMFSVDKVWKATLQHGFRPLQITTYNSK